MALTPEQLETFKRPFLYADHEFTRGFVYITEEAITARIEEVDPAWEFNVMTTSRADNQAVCHARLTVCGVTRDGVGMQQVMEKAGEPEKGAATDALKRAARLFGIGRYLLGAPKEGREFDQWLAQEQKKAGAPPVLRVLPSAVTPPATRSDQLLDEMTDERRAAIKDAVSGDGSFLCDRIERKEKAGKRWLVFHALTPSDGSAIAWARSEVNGLKDSILPEHYNLLENVGTVYIGELDVTWKKEVKNGGTNRLVVGVAIPEVVQA